ncbi:hypothetical protein KOW79_015797 [Hemibagrus wyckioides]|uniref:Uncharacterized protein n=1 Tax=Hemibagrus wyckioides TaxID=337641 RepID=A0A9D3SEM8_9TELE|nr:hypothetical protein KOW79_015797 [Hemibagrus wyckioides]
MCEKSPSVNNRKCKDCRFHNRPETQRDSRITFLLQTFKYLQSDKDGSKRGVENRGGKQEQRERERERD